MICPQCDGSGVITLGCPRCNNSGEGMTDGGTCYYCCGRGDLGPVSCEECYGTGRVCCWSCGENKEHLLPAPYGMMECSDCQELQE